VSHRKEDKADAIFVFAGRESRKRLGVELWKGGLSDRLVLSVGRFEWRRFASLPLPSDGGLVDQVGKTEPRLRHFFVDVRPEGASCERIPLGRLGTWSEARALASFAAREGLGNLIVVSHRQHLIRCVLCLRLALPETASVRPIEAPDDDLGGPLGEAFKLLAYRVLLGPLWARRLFRTGLRPRAIPAIKSRFTLSQPGLREREFRPPEVQSAPTLQGDEAEGES
jgi:hypothetical protein